MKDTVVYEARPRRPARRRTAIPLKGEMARLHHIAEAPDLESAFLHFFDAALVSGFHSAMVARFQTTADGVDVLPAMGEGPLNDAVRDYREAKLNIEDPILRAALAAKASFSASAYFDDPSPRADGSLLPQVIEIMRDNSVGYTAAIPLVGLRAGFRGVMVVAGETKIGGEHFDEVFARNEWYLRLAARELGVRALRLADTTPDLRLTQSERIALDGLAAGRRPEEIALMTGRSVSTVRHQIESARRRLGAQTVIEAVASAVRLGLLV